MAALPDVLAVALAHGLNLHVALIAGSARSSPSSSSQTPGFGAVTPGQPMTTQLPHITRLRLRRRPGVEKASVKGVCECVLPYGEGDALDALV